MAQKLFALFNQNTKLDDLLNQLGESKQVSKFTVYGNSEMSADVSADPDGLEIDLLRAGGKSVAGNSVSGDPLGATTPSLSVAKPTGMFMLGESGLEAEGLSPEVASYFSRSVESGSRVIVVETKDRDATEAMLNEAGGVVSRG